ncbi:Phosphoribosylglycinamide formyltransferase [Corynebacterium kalinowskii]|uniref:Phosphoribosylglycinamide formyltransferase n=1 Tax=Corynebacterium kalinowskii TaxID=2675216 RepID=A0A6B8VV16_9CORY|nr:phosphoribosylglycinamide formyltransferase [Corynebacterium kalinowskii]QGU02566.1 Phosphoribosylglycinamide formyltransferase [Corynebacterium kalinowskii]
MASRSVVILASGTGTLAESIIRSAGDGYQVVGVIVDRECRAMDVARDNGVAFEAVIYKDYDAREEWNRALVDAIAAFTPDLIVSAGFMRILGEPVLERFGGKIINTHPALLPSFKGGHAVRDALDYGVRVTGSTVHVVDAGVDTGPIIAQVPVAVEIGDTEETLHERIKVAERALIVRVLNSSNPFAAQ